MSDEEIPLSGDDMIDLRSDTITKPTNEMRQVMANAEVGDDVFGDDVTANLLEKRVAELLGKEDALFVPSGTMANQIAIRSLTSLGDEILLHEHAHCYLYESGSAFVMSGVVPRFLHGERGMFKAEDVENSLKPDDVHFPPTSLVCLENTTNMGGGAVWSIEEIENIKKVADKNNLKMHLDGARLWNAAVASGISEKEYAKYFRGRLSSGIAFPVCKPNNACSLVPIILRSSPSTL